MKLLVPGYKYLGINDANSDAHDPMYFMENPPINILDSIAMEHDREYNLIRHEGGSLADIYARFNIADRRFIDNVRNRMPEMRGSQRRLALLSVTWFQMKQVANFMATWKVFAEDVNELESWQNRLEEYGFDRIMPKGPDPPAGYNPPNWEPKPIAPPPPEKGQDPDGQWVYIDIDGNIWPIYIPPGHEAPDGSYNTLPPNQPQVHRTNAEKLVKPVYWTYKNGKLTYVVDIYPLLDSSYIYDGKRLFAH